MAKRPALLVRMSDDQLVALEAEYRRTYAQHGLSRNAWYLQALLALLAPIEQES